MKYISKRISVATLFLIVILIFGGIAVFADRFMPPEPFDIWSDDGTTVFKWTPGPEDTWHYWRGEARGSVYRNDELVYTINNLHAIGESEHSFLFSDCFRYLAYSPSVSQVVAIAFFSDGELLRVYRIDELIRDMSVVLYSVTTASWENRQGRKFDAYNNKLTIVTRDDITYVFDITTGEIVYDTVGDTLFIPPAEDSWGYFANESAMPLWAQNPRGGMPSTWAQESIDRAAEIGLQPGQFRSGFGRNTTRAEFAAIAIALYEHFTEPITGRRTFSDTTDTNVEKAAYLGIVFGVGDNRFDPNTPLTREQAAVMLHRLAVAMNHLLPDATPSFADNSNISSWAVNSVGIMQAVGIMSGVGNNRFDPQGSYTREQSIVTIMRLFDLLNGA